MSLAPLTSQFRDGHRACAVLGQKLSGCALLGWTSANHNLLEGWKEYLLEIRLVHHVAL